MTALQLSDWVERSQSRCMFLRGIRLFERRTRESSGKSILRVFSRSGLLQTTVEIPDTPRIVRNTEKHTQSHICWRLTNIAYFFFENSHCGLPEAHRRFVWTVCMDGPYGRSVTSVRTVRTDGPYRRSVRTARTDRPYPRCVRTVRTDGPYGRSVRRVCTDDPYETKT